MCKCAQGIDVWRCQHAQTDAPGIPGATFAAQERAHSAEGKLKHVCWKKCNLHEPSVRKVIFFFCVYPLLSSVTVFPISLVLSLSLDVSYYLPLSSKNKRCIWMCVNVT